MSLEYYIKEQEEKEKEDKFWDHVSKVNEIISEEDEDKKDELKIKYGFDLEETRGIL